MANERLIDANHFAMGVALYMAENAYLNDTALDVLKKISAWLDEEHTVEAVETKKYEALVEMYHELRENFIDFVCSGIPNVAPYCLNRCEGCCDAHGWCRQTDKCKGFNPAEVLLDEERRNNVKD